MTSDQSNIKETVHKPKITRIITSWSQFQRQAGYSNTTSSSAQSPSCGLSRLRSLSSPPQSSSSISSPPFSSTPTLSMNDSASMTKMSSDNASIISNSTISDLTVWYDSDEFMLYDEEQKGDHDGNDKENKQQFIQWLEERIRPNHIECFTSFRQHIDEEYDDEIDTDYVLEDLQDDENNSEIMGKIRDINNTNKMPENCEEFKFDIIRLIKNYKNRWKQNIKPLRKNALHHLYICTGQRCDNQLALYMFNRKKLDYQHKLSIIQQYFWSSQDIPRKLLVDYLRLPLSIPFKDAQKTLHDKLADDEFFIDEDLKDIDIVDLFEKVLFHKQNGRLLCKLSQITCLYNANDLKSEIVMNRKHIRLSDVKKQIQKFSFKNQICNDQFIVSYLLENNHHFQILNQNYTKILEFDCRWKKFYMVLKELMDTTKNIGINMNFDANALTLYYCVPSINNISTNNINILLNQYLIWSTTMDEFKSNDRSNIILKIVNPDPNLLPIMPIPLEGVVNTQHRKFVVAPFTVPTPSRNIESDFTSNSDGNIWTIKQFEASTIICFDHTYNASDEPEMVEVNKPMPSEPVVCDQPKQQQQDNV